MTPRLHSRPPAALRVVRTLLVVLVVSGIGNLRADSLTSRSPFVPAGFQPPGEMAAASAAAAPATSLEFRGYYKIADTYYFLVSPRNQAGRWLAQGESEEGFVVNQFDATGNRVLVQYNGQTQWVELAETAAVTGSAPAQLASVNPGGQSALGQASAPVPARRSSGIATARNSSSAQGGNSSVARSIVRPGSSGSTVAPRIPRYPIPGRSFSGTVSEPLTTPMAPPAPPTVQAPDYIPPRPPAEEPPPPVLR